jgi:hypothetical protein
MAADAPSETIYFFRESNRVAKKLKDANWVGNIGTSGLIAVLLIVLEWLATRVGIGSGLWLFLLFAFLIGVVFVRFSVWRRRRRLYADLPGESPGETRRLACVGLPDRLLQHGELADRSFEPVISSGTFVQPFPRRMNVVTVLLMPAMALLMHVLLTCLPASIANQPHAYVMGRIYCGVALAVLIVGWLWPTYFRIVPGGLDVLRFNNILNRPVEAEHHDLRKARVLVDLRRGVVFIDHEDGHSVELPIRWMRGQERFAYYLFLAAMSSHQPPPLPDDRLLG